MQRFAAFVFAILLGLPTLALASPPIPTVHLVGTVETPVTQFPNSHDVAGANLVCDSAISTQVTTNYGGWGGYLGAEGDFIGMGQVLRAPIYDGGHDALLTSLSFGIGFDLTAFTPANDGRRPAFRAFIIEWSNETPGNLVSMSAPVEVTVQSFQDSVPGFNFTTFVMPSAVLASGQTYMIGITQQQTDITLYDPIPALIQVSQHLDGEGGLYILAADAQDPVPSSYFIAGSLVGAAGYDVAFTATFACASESVTAPAPGTFGDPHITTRSGVVVTYTGCGDQILLQDKDSGLMVQGRHCMRGGDGSSTCGVALQCSLKSDVLELYALKDRVQAFSAGAELHVTSANQWELNGLSLSRKARSFEAACTNGIKMVVTLREASSFMYFDMTLQGAIPLMSSGLLGSSKSIVDRSGKEWNPGHGLDYLSTVEHPSLLDVQESWIVSSGEALFRLTTADSDAVCNSFARHKLLSSKMIDPVETSEAADLCKAEGMTGVYLRTCMFDYIATGDKAFIKNAAALH